MHNNYGQGVDYEKVKRILAGVVALVLWGLSIKFSVSGFGAGIDDKEIWIGWLLGFSITVIQLVWNGIKGRANLTLWVLGLSAYLYGIYTNIMGIMVWRGDTFETLANNPFILVFPIILGLFLEIAPEPLFVWAFTKKLDEGDFLGNLLGTQMPNNNQQIQHRVIPNQVPPGILNHKPQQQYHPILNGRNQAKKNNNHKHPFGRREE
jgi:hypothetical protein